MNNFDQKIKDKLSQPQAPPLDAWTNIENQLHKKPKRKIVPIFIWLSSSAACIAIFAFLFFSSKNNEQKTSSDFVINKKEQIKNTKKLNKDAVFVKTRDDDSFENTYIVNHTNVDTKTMYKNISYNSLTAPQNIYTKEIDNNTEFGDYWNNYYSNLGLNSRNEKLKSNSIDGENIAYQASQVKLPVVKNDDEKFLEEILLEEETRHITKETTKSSPKLAISSFVSPTLLLDSKSILSSTFNANTLQNDITVSYGAKVSYIITDNIKVRAGIAKIDLAQNTNNITTSSVSNMSSINAIHSDNNFANNPENIKYTSEISILNNAEDFPNKYYLSADNKMNQKLEFVEIPIEIELNLFKHKRFNISAIGGGSYFILTKNEIDITNSTSGKLKIGEASNVNNTSFSANGALKFEYLFNNKIGINLEPHYKLLLNPIKDNPNNSSSLIGINLGMSFQLK